MKKNKLRLLVTDKCTRNCIGCCNNDIKPSGSISEDDVMLTDWGIYEELIITGGEPLLYPFQLKNLLDHITPYYDVPIILYTAIWPVMCIDVIDRIFNNLTGITFTIHDKQGIRDFVRLDIWLRVHHNIILSPEAPFIKRLNIFCDVPFYPFNCYGWDVKFIEWIDKCPLPENEIFLQLNPLFNTQWQG